jgi:hypothetical protein
LASIAEARSGQAVQGAESQGSSAELEQLRADHAELLRLRGEVSALRAQMKEARAKPQSQTAESASKGPDETHEPVQIFVANASATVAAGEALALGGWQSAPGKRIVVMVQPKVMDVSSEGHVGSVLLEGKFIELSEDILDSVGLGKLKAESKATSLHSRLSMDQVKSALEAFESSPGVDVLSAPRVQTGDGTQANISVTEQKTIAGQEHALGPSLDVEPRIGTDGSSVTLTVSARYKRQTP